jgi:hypothetical protein
MEHDMYQEILDCQWIKDKIRNSKTYAQNMYAAMCNMQWQKRDVMPILKDELWSCSWRSAGGKMAEIRGGGEDYMDYYCSGIRNVDYDEEINKTWDEKGFASEGEVTDEIRHDLGLLGWQPVPYDDKDLV